MAKLHPILALLVESDRHLCYAAHALNALDAEVPGKLVNRHLIKIAEREELISEFLQHIANGKAFEEERDDV